MSTTATEMRPSEASSTRKNKNAAFLDQRDPFQSDALTIPSTLPAAVSSASATGNQRFGKLRNSVSSHHQNQNQNLDGEDDDDAVKRIVYEEAPVANESSKPAAANASWSASGGGNKKNHKANATIPSSLKQAEEEKPRKSDNNNNNAKSSNKKKNKGGRRSSYPLPARPDAPYDEVVVSSYGDEYGTDYHLSPPPATTTSTSSSSAAPGGLTTAHHVPTAGGRGGLKSTRPTREHWPRVLGQDEETLARFSSANPRREWGSSTRNNTNNNNKNNKANNNKTDLSSLNGQNKKNNKKRVQDSGEAVEGGLPSQQWLNQDRVTLGAVPANHWENAWAEAKEETRAAPRNLRGTATKDSPSSPQQPRRGNNNNNNKKKTNQDKWMQEQPSPLSDQHPLECSELEESDDDVLEEIRGQQAQNQQQRQRQAQVGSAKNKNKNKKTAANTQQEWRQQQPTAAIEKFSASASGSIPPPPHTLAGKAFGDSVGSAAKKNDEGKNNNNNLREAQPSSSVGNIHTNEKDKGNKSRGLVASPIAAENNTTTNNNNTLVAAKKGSPSSPKDKKIQPAPSGPNNVVNANAFGEKKEPSAADTTSIHGAEKKEVVARQGDHTMVDHDTTQKSDKKNNDDSDSAAKKKAIIPSSSPSSSGVAASTTEQQQLKKDAEYHNRRHLRDFIPFITHGSKSEREVKKSEEKARKALEDEERKTSKLLESQKKSLKKAMAEEEKLMKKKGKNAEVAEKKKSTAVDKSVSENANNNNTKNNENNKNRSVSLLDSIVDKITRKSEPEMKQQDFESKKAAVQGNNDRSIASASIIPTATDTRGKTNNKDTAGQGQPSPAKARPRPDRRAGKRKYRTNYGSIVSGFEGSPTRTPLGMPSASFTPEAQRQREEQKARRRGSAALAKEAERPILAQPTSLLVPAARPYDACHQTAAEQGFYFDAMSKKKPLTVVDGQQQLQHGSARGGIVASSNTTNKKKNNIKKNNKKSNNNNSNARGMMRNVPLSQQQQQRQQRGGVAHSSAVVPGVTFRDKVLNSTAADSAPTVIVVMPPTATRSIESVRPSSFSSRRRRAMRRNRMHQKKRNSLPFQQPSADLLSPVTAAYVEGIVEAEDEALIEETENLLRDRGDSHFRNRKN